MNRQASIRNLNNSTDDPVWYLISEFSLSDFILNNNQSGCQTTDYLFPNKQEMGVIPEWVTGIEATLARFAKEVQGYFKPDEWELPGKVRIFCQKKIIEHVYVEGKASQPDPAMQAVISPPMTVNSGRKINGGWGYYCIEKGRDSTGIPVNEGPGHTIEIYVYREPIESP